MALPDCTICLEGCNKSTRKAATCPYCDQSVCRTCIQTYLLNDQAAEHRCPNCHAVWNDEFLTASLTGVFRHGLLKKHRTKILLDMEKSRMPDFQDRTRVYLNAKELMAQAKPTINEVREKLMRARARHHQLAKLHKTTLCAAKRKKIADEMLKTQNAIFFAQQEIRRLGDENRHVFELVRHYGAVPGVEAAPTTRRTWRSKCPRDKCEGFLGDDFKCGLCVLQACSECHEPVTEGHVCNADTLASVRALAQEARPCPTCAARISKIDGCDQMWCTQCRTAFSWITGNIETTVVHNPHYYQWMRETGQTIPRAGAAPVAPCGIAQIETWFLTHRLATHCAFSFLRELGHIQSYQTRAERDLHTWTNPTRMIGRCVRRLASELDDAAWEREIEKEQQSITLLRASAQFHQMCVQVQSAIFGRVLELPANSTDDDRRRAVDGLYTELKQFITYRAETARRLRLTHRAPDGTFYGEQVTAA